VGPLPQPDSAGDLSLPDAVPKRANELHVSPGQIGGGQAAPG
jgi:hypothetical protein